MGEWTKASQKKKRNKGYVPPDWVKDVEKTADEMSTSDFFQKVIESLTSKLSNFAKDQISMVILGLGQPHQLALAVCLARGEFKISVKECFDPEFSDADLAIIRALIPTAENAPFQPHLDQDLVIFAPHLPHEVIEQVLADRQASNAQTCFIVNDLNEMTLATKSQIANFGPNLAKMVDSEQFREKNVLELENSWATEPGAFNSLCFLTI